MSNLPHYDYLDIRRDLLSVHYLEMVLYLVSKRYLVYLVLGYYCFYRPPSVTFYPVVVPACDKHRFVLSV